MDIRSEKKGLAANETLNYYDSKCNDENNGSNNDSTVIAIVFIIALAIIIVVAIILLSHGDIDKKS